MDQKGGYPPGAYPQHQPPPGSYPQQGPGGYPQQPPSYAGQQSSTVVVTAQPVVTAGVIFHETPVPLKCMHCQADVVTSTEYEVGTLAWVVCGVIILIGCVFPLLWLCCCFIPFCVPACKDVVHKCPNCNQTVGRYNRM